MLIDVDGLYDRVEFIIWWWLFMVNVGGDSGFLGGILLVYLDVVIELNFVILMFEGL